MGKSGETGAVREISLILMASQKLANCCIAAMASLLQRT
jgi:hypothetical protein